MKAFRFRLQRVLELRESELKTEEAALEHLWYQRSRMVAERDALVASSECATAEICTQRYLHPSDLVMMDRYKETVKRELLRYAEKLKAHDVSIDKQKARVVAARGRVKLLEKLRDKSQQEWQQAADHELEELAADFSAAQWLRSHT
jgi:flagellar biosynthesis chaperone FliJ